MPTKRSKKSARKSTVNGTKRALSRVTKTTRSRKTAKVARKKKRTIKIKHRKRPNGKTIKYKFSLIV